MSLLTVLLIVTFSLILELAVLGLLVYGYQKSRRFAFPQHGLVMAIAVFLHLSAIAAIMIPSFILAIVPEYLFTRISNVVSLLSLVHVPLGGAALALGLWFVIRWRQCGLKGCFNRKKLMAWTFAIWIAALLLGIILYVVLYWAALVG
jgi:uncharacterized membrane protein YozB (DUF420 family)